MVCCQLIHCCCYCEYLNTADSICYHLILFLSIGKEGVKIQWNLDTKTHVIPIENVDQIMPSETRSTRSRSRRSSKRACRRESPTSQLINKSLKLSTETTNTPLPNQKKQNWKKLPSRNPKEILEPFKLETYDGPPVQTMIAENNNKTQYFLKLIFGENIIKLEGELNGEIQKLEPKVVYDGKEYHIIISKLKEKKLQSAIHERTSKRWYVAYYVCGDDISSAADVKRKLEELGDFSEIAMQPGKVCSRLELMVSPACAMCPGLFKLHRNEFELIEENQNVGK